MENLKNIDLKNLKFGEESCVKITPYELLELNENIKELQKEVEFERKRKEELLTAILDNVSLLYEEKAYISDKSLSNIIEKMYPIEWKERVEQLIECEKAKKLENKEAKN